MPVGQTKSAVEKFSTPLDDGWPMPGPVLYRLVNIRAHLSDAEGPTPEKVAVERALAGEWCGREEPKGFFSRTPLLPASRSVDSSVNARNCRTGLGGGPASVTVSGSPTGSLRGTSVLGAAGSDLYS